MNEYLRSPKEHLRSLRIYKALIKKQITYFPLSWELLRLQSKKLIEVIDLHINDYEEYFKNRNLAANSNSHQLSFEDNTLD